MDHRKEYWFKLSYEQQKKKILIEFITLTELWSKTPHNVKLLMNRCIKYTQFSIEDAKNQKYINELEDILESEKQFKEDYDNPNLEGKIRKFFDDSYITNNEDPLDIVNAFINDIELNTPQSRMSIIQYNDKDDPIASFTGTFNEIFDFIDNPSSYYYRVAKLNQNTIRERVKAVHFGIKTSCVGGLSFDLDEAIHRYLNYQIKSYAKGKCENFFYTLCHVEWYKSLLAQFEQLSEDGMNNQISKLVASFPDLYEVNDLDTFREKAGIYILVLDKYHVCYVGQSNDITHRVMAHWSKSNYFTGTGIDLFKPLDTTRIFVKLCESQDIDKTEYQIIACIDPKYSLNVLTGGTIDYHIENDIPLLNEPAEEWNIFDEMINTHRNAMNMEKLFIIE